MTTHCKIATSAHITMTAVETTRAPEDNARGPREAQQTLQDSFQKYSDDAVRLRALLCREGDAAFDVRRFAKRKYRVASSDVAESSVIAALDDAGRRKKEIRKTKISFELHPTLIFDDLLDDDDEDAFDDAAGGPPSGVEEFDVLRLLALRSR